MVNAFTFDDGSPKSFNSRKAMYDWMIENGHSVVEGDDTQKFDAHLVASKSEKAVAAQERVRALRGM